MITNAIISILSSGLWTGVSLSNLEMKEKGKESLSCCAIVKKHTNKRCVFSKLRSVSNHGDVTDSMWPSIGMHHSHCTQYVCCGSKLLMFCSSLWPINDNQGCACIRSVLSRLCDIYGPFRSVPSRPNCTIIVAAECMRAYNIRTFVNSQLHWKLIALDLSTAIRTINTSPLSSASLNRFP